MIKIYTLKCPITNEIRYVGQTSASLKVRLWGHLSSPNKAMKEWIESLGDLNPIIEEIDSVEENEAPQQEIFWINKLKEQGCNLINKQVKPIDYSSQRRSRYHFKQPTQINMEQPKQSPTPTEKVTYKFEVAMPEHIYLELCKLRDKSFPKWCIHDYLNTFLEFAIPIVKIDSARNDAEHILEIVNDEKLSQEDKIKWIDILK